MTHIFLLQQNIVTLQDDLEQAIQIEAMERYPQDYKLGVSSSETRGSYSYKAHVILGLVHTLPG